MLTIDELAAQAGMTVRNVRAHQSRGLLPPPEVRGRTGYYGPEHAARLELIKEMQADGFNLHAIGHALAQVPPGAAVEVLAFRRALVRPWTEEQPEIVDLAALARLTGRADLKLVSDAVKLGILRPLDGDGSRYEVPSPTLLRAGAQMVELGVPLDAVLGVQRVLQRSAEAVARAYVGVFLDHVWHPFVAAGRPEERWHEVRESLERMQPLASQSLLATFRLVMQEAVEEAAGAESESLTAVADTTEHVHAEPGRDSA